MNICYRYLQIKRKECLGTLGHWSWKSLRQKKLTGQRFAFCQRNFFMYSHNCLITCTIFALYREYAFKQSCFRVWYKFFVSSYILLIYLIFTYFTIPEQIISLYYISVIGKLHIHYTINNSYLKVPENYKQKKRMKKTQLWYDYT